MRFQSCHWLLGVSLLWGVAARAAPDVVISGERELVSQDFGDQTDVRFQANAKLRAAAGSKIELKARRFVFEGPVTLDARGAPGLPGEAAKDRDDARIEMISPSEPQPCELNESDRGPSG